MVFFLKLRVGWLAEVNTEVMHLAFPNCPHFSFFAVISLLATRLQMAVSIHLPPSRVFHNPLLSLVVLHAGFFKA